MEVFCIAGGGGKSHSAVVTDDGRSFTFGSNLAVSWPEPTGYSNVSKAFKIIVIIVLPPDVASELYEYVP